MSDDNILEIVFNDKTYNIPLRKEIVNHFFSCFSHSEYNHSEMVDIFQKEMQEVITEDKIDNAEEHILQLVNDFIYVKLEGFRKLDKVNKAFLNQIANQE